MVREKLGRKPTMQTERELGEKINRAEHIWKKGSGVTTGGKRWL